MIRAKLLRHPKYVHSDMQFIRRLRDIKSAAWEALEWGIQAW